MKPETAKLLKAFLLSLVIIAWVPILGVLGFVMFEIYCRGFVCPDCDETGFWRQVRCGTAETYESYAQYYRHLPTDEEMIWNFYRHRTDFDRLVHVYREDLSVPCDWGSLLPTPELRDIMKRINVIAVYDDSNLWMPPDPYSDIPVVRERRHKLESDSHNPQRRKFSGIMFRYQHKEVRSMYTAPLRKYYYYIPLIPKVERGILAFPGTRLEPDTLVVDTLNTLPADLVPFGAACREIEPHWYIRIYQGQSRW